MSHDPNKLNDTCCKCGKVYLCYDAPMLKTDLWEKVFPEEEDWFQTHPEFKSFYVCADCMEKELGRPLIEEDLLLSDRHKHVIWNTKFVKERFPQHKYGLEQDTVDELVKQYKKELNIP